MTHYVDGFVVPVPLENLDAYRRMSETCGKIWTELGALQYWECVGDDVKPGKVTSFPQASSSRTARPSCFRGSSTSRARIATASTRRSWRTRA